MFEMPPFRKCPECRKDSAFGVLFVHSDHYERRCRFCRHTQPIPLSLLNKHVIYLDQFAISELVKIRSGNPYRGHHGSFFTALDKAIRRLLLDQQAIFPDSDLHRDESIVSGFHEGLRDLYEDINGDVSLLSDTDVQLGQIEAFARSWLGGRGVPRIAFDVDEVLEGTRNAWLPPLNIRVNMDYSIFIGELEQSRSRVEASMASLFKKWKHEQKPFREVLREELNAYGKGYLNELRINAERKMRVFEGNEDLTPKTFGTKLEGFIATLRRVMRSHSVPDNNVWAEIVRFLQWEGLRDLPCHRISAYMYAALARKAAGNAKDPPNRGMMNDVLAISSYAPYVDAMFVDNECATLLSEGPLNTDLTYKAKIFSLKTRDEFLAYLSVLQAAADAAVIAEAKEVYG